MMRGRGLDTLGLDVEFATQGKCAFSENDLGVLLFIYSKFRMNLSAVVSSKY